MILASNGAVSWQSRKESLIALLTLETEYIACSEASKAKWLLQLEGDIHGSQKDPSLLPIQRQNQGALALITTGTIKARTKNIDVFYHCWHGIWSDGLCGVWPKAAGMRPVACDQPPCRGVGLAPPVMLGIGLRM